MRKKGRVLCIYTVFKIINKLLWGKTYQNGAKFGHRVAEGSAEATRNGRESYAKYTKNFRGCLKIIQNNKKALAQWTFK
jgi:hypothetical protein